jgi:hypothetical protein
MPAEIRNVTSRNRGGALAMPRPRKYTSDATRAAAYRERRESLTKRVDRKALEAPVAAVEAAAAAGDPDAQTIRTGTVDALLRNLARLFETRAGK